MFSIIYVDFYSIEKTLSACKNLIEKTSKEELKKLHFLIVDNSNEGSCEHYIRSYFEIKEEKIFLEKKCIVFTYLDLAVTAIITKENLGYARGNNIGIKYAECYYQDLFTVVSNNDVITNDYLEWGKVERFFQNHEKALSWGPQILDKKSGKEINPKKRLSFFEQMFIYYWRLISRGYIAKNFSTVEKKDKPGKCYTLTGSFVIFNNNLLKKIGLYDPHTFLFYEENIIGEKTYQSGYYNWYSTAWRFIHEHGYTIKKNSIKVKSEIESFKSGCYYYKKYRNISRLLISFAMINFLCTYMPYLFLKLAYVKIREHIKC